MLKFIRGKGHHLSAERIKTQRELFAYHKTITHGFPTKPSAMAYDVHLKVLAIGTKAGALKVVGKPGVEFSGQHPSDEASVLKIIFLSKQGRLITLCDDNSLHLWQIQNSSASLELVKSQLLEGKLKKISCLAPRQDESVVYIGTEGGNVYTLDPNRFEITDKTIYMDVVLQNGPENYKVNPGAIEAVLEHPQEATKLLIGYERGLIVLWDLTEQRTVKHYLYSQQLENLSWLRMPVTTGESLYFVSAHNDGSYVIWDINKTDKPFKEATTPYGPYPCKKISKLQVFQEEGGEPEGFLMIFAGGMPRAAYGDHHTVTVMKDGPQANGSGEGDETGSPHVVFDLSSRIIDFAVIPSTDEEAKEPGYWEQPSALVILAEEEMVVVDLTREDWPVFHPQPYLNCLHPSALTCFHHVSAPSNEVYEALKRIGRDSWEADKISSNTWPIQGGTTTEIKREREILITGHEDGSVRFWDSTGSCLTFLCKFSSSVLFSSDEMAGDHSRDEDDEEWPPFRKVGTFDPYSDDPRLAVKKIAFCPKTGVLSVGGTAGQVVVVTTLKKSEEQVKLEVDSCNLVADKDGFAWKGHDALDFKPKNNPTEQYLTVTALLQIQPPAAVTALAIEAPSGVVAVGTAHGVLLYDFFRKKVVMTKSTLNPNDIMAAGDTPISRRKSIKKSLRESFRRLRKGRSQRAPTSSPPLKSPSSGVIQSPSGLGMGDTKPMERAIEARSTDDAMASMIRTVSFSKTYIISLQSTTGTLWVGTNSGAVYVFTVSVPGGEKRSKEAVSCIIAKEIQLKHRAPVLSVIVLDCNTAPVDGFSLQHDHLGPHKVLIGSEEQIKIFTLPSLRPFGKLKLTAHEGSRVRKMQVATFVSTADAAYSEKCLVSLTNQGDLYVIAVPELRKQLMAQCLRREDISGIASLVFNEKGEAFHMCSSSELQRLSLSAKNITRPLCSIPISQPQVTTEFSEREIRVQSPSTSAGVDNSKNEVKVEEVVQEVADITIDSVRDHTTGGTSTSVTPNTTLNTSVVEVSERLIDGPVISSSSTVTSRGSGPNQIKSVTTVTTTVVNSVQNSAGDEAGALVGASLLRAPLAPVDETQID